MKNLKHFGSLMRVIFWEIVHAIRNKRTWIAVGIITFLYVYAWFWRNYYIQSPIKEIKYQCFICKANNKPIVATVSAQIVQPLPTIIALKPVLTEKEIVMNLPHGAILWKIYFLESGLGEKDGCRINKEGYGGFGVKDGKKVVCYDTFQKAAERAEYWFAKLNPDKDLAKALCMWNLGVPEINCNYYQTYMSL